MAVQQISLDVEVWVNASLHSELANRGMAYHSLIDYDLQLAEVGSITVPHVRTYPDVCMLTGKLSHIVYPLVV